MSRADDIFIQNCREIIDHGTWDTDLNVRPHWEDGTPAHTVKRFGIVNRYNLAEEFPILTIRRTSVPASGTPGRTKTDPSARRTVISWA